MSIKCEAIVEQGLLRPLVDLGLQNAERVTLTVERQATVASPRTVADQLRAGGVTHLRVADASALAGCNVENVGLEQVNACLPLRIPGKTLSATIIEERHEGW